ncbi:MAG: sensor histidine kinase [Arachnia sp.]
MALRDYIVDRLAHSEDVVQWIMGVALAICAVIALPMSISEAMAGGRPLLIDLGLWGTVAVQIAIAFCGLFRPNITWPIAIAASISIVLMAAGLVGPEGARAVDTWEANRWAWIPLTYLLGLHPRRLAWVVYLGVLVATSWAVVTHFDFDWRVIVLQATFVASPLAKLVLAGFAVGTMVEEMLKDRGRAITASERERIQRSRDHERRRQVRRTHDTVLQVLQQATGRWPGVNPAQVASVARTTLRSLTDLRVAEAPPSRELVSVVAALHSEPELRAVSIAADVADADLPRFVVDALRGAAAEAVRNARKHAPGATVRIRVSELTHGIRVIITDDGPGFEVARDTQRRFGIREAILGRMVDVGGLARVNSGQRGTKVELCWPAETHSSSSHRFANRVYRAMAWIAAPVLVASVIHTAIYPTGVPVWLVLSVHALIFGLIALIVRANLCGRQLRTVHTVALSVIGAILIVANYSWVDPELVNGWMVWTPALVGAVFLVAAPELKFSHALIGAILMVVVTFSASWYFLGLDQTSGSMLGALIASAQAAFVVLVVATLAALLRQRLNRQANLEVQAELERLAIAERRKLRESWIAHLVTVAGPILRRVGEQHEQIDLRVAREAGFVEARLRDDLTLWPEFSDLAASADTLRRRGWTLNMVDPDTSRAGELAQLLARFPPAMADQRITVSNDVVTVVPGPSPEQQTHLPEPSLVVDALYVQFALGSAALRVNEQDKPVEVGL